MITPDKKTKKKNLITALAIIVFMIFLFFFTLYNTGAFDRSIWLKKRNERTQVLRGSFSAVSTATIARVGAFCSFFQDLID